MRSKSSKAEEKTEVVKDNDKLQIKTINKCAKLNPNRSFAKKAKQVKLNIKKVSVYFQLLTESCYMLFFSV